MSFLFISPAKSVTRDWTDKNGQQRRTIDYFGKASGNETGSEAYRTTVVSGYPLPTHCHPVDQYQLFFGTAVSRYQRRPVGSLVLHYADAYTAYGPLDNVSYLTLRAVPTKTMLVMPEDRHQVPYRGRRHFTIDLSGHLATAEPPHGAVRCDPLIGPADDGLEALLVSASSGAAVPLPRAGTKTSGQFTYVLAGELSFAGEAYPAGSLGWQESGDEPTGFAAGPAGCRFLVLRFPYPATPAAASSQAEPG